MLEYPTVPPGTQAPGRALVARFGRSISGIMGALIGLLLVLIIFGVWRPRTFLSTLNFLNVLRYNYHLIVAAVGATFVIITAGIDLSAGSVIAFSSVACAMAVTGFGVPAFDPFQALTIAGGAGLLCGLCAAGRALQAGAPKSRAVLAAAVAGGIGLVVAGAVWWAIAGHTFSPVGVWLGICVGIGAGAAVGLLNGALITMLSLPPFIVTLATLEAVRGLTLDITNATPIHDLPAGLRYLHRGDWLGLPPNVWVALAAVLIAAPILHYSVLGRYAYAIGSNERTARLCGVRVERWKTICYVIAGATAGLAGVMMAASFGSAQPDEFKGEELKIIAAVVIGGTSLFGGEGTVIGSVIGVLMIGFLHSGCNLAGIPDNRQRIFIGGVIVLAAALDRFRHLLR